MHPRIRRRMTRAPHAAENLAKVFGGTCERSEQPHYCSYRANLVRAPRRSLRGNGSRGCGVLTTAPLRLPRSHRGWKARREPSHNPARYGLFRDPSLRGVDGKLPSSQPSVPKGFRSHPGTDFRTTRKPRKGFRVYYRAPLLRALGANRFRFLSRIGCASRTATDENGRRASAKNARRETQNTRLPSSRGCESIPARNRREPARALPGPAPPLSRFRATGRVRTTRAPSVRVVVTRAAFCMTKCRTSGSPWFRPRPKRDPPLPLRDFSSSRGKVRGDLSPLA